MDETLMLLMLVFVMLIGSYMAGNIPLVIILSEKKLQGVTIFGAGLLVGTALAVIIPEGIRSLYDDNINIVQKSNSLTSSVPLVNTDDLIQHNSNHHHQTNDHSSAIGLSLVLGFIFMMLIDQISTRYNEGVPHSERNVTATIGLVVHAAVDGVALGAAATTSHHDVEMIVFLAIMLHKAPAAFGLVTFLLHEGIERNKIRKHLLLFSLAAPLLTLITYFCIAKEQKETLNSFNATGIAMLFSAGTFLYVATVHVLPELTHQNNSAGKRAGFTHLEQPMSAQTKNYSSLSYCDLCSLIIGVFVPLLITIFHHH